MMRIYNPSVKRIAMWRDSERVLYFVLTFPTKRIYD